MIEKRLIICSVSTFNDNRSWQRATGETVYLTGCDMEKERVRIENEKLKPAIFSFSEHENLIFPLSKAEYNKLGRPSVGDMITVKMEILAEAI